MYDMDTTKTVTHISLCAGYAGIDLGIKRAIRDLRTIAFCDVEAYVCANLVAKMEAGLLDAAPIWTNLKTFPFSDFCDKVGILSGGFPCQPFSSAGKRAGDSDPRHLFPYIKQGIIDSRPDVVFLENVEGILSAKLSGSEWADPAGTPVLLHVLRELERVGYRATAGIFSSSEIGATHQRKRVFILGLANNNNKGLARRWKSGEFNGEERRENSQGYSPKGCLGNGEWIFSRPAGQGPDQFWWEPPRTIVLGNAKKLRMERERTQQQTTRALQSSKMGNPKGLFGNVGGDNEGEQPRPESLSQSRDPSGEDSMDDSSSKGLERPAGQSLQGRGEGLACSNSQQEQSSESSLGGDFNGSTDWMDYAKLCESVDSRNDELRLIGNGVDPDVAHKAFTTLMDKLLNHD